MDLLQKNAIDSIQLGFEDYFRVAEDERRIISSIRNIYSGISLLFKAEIKKRSPKNCGDTLIKKWHSLEVHGDTILAKGKGNRTIGLHDFKERFRLINISVDDEINELKKLAELRNSIEHHFTDAPKEMLENSVLEAFWLLKQFNEKYSKLEKDELFNKKTWGKLIEIETNYNKLKKECESKWKEIDFKDIANRIFPVAQEDDVEESEIINGFLAEINCPSCRSDLVEPVESNFSENTDIDMKCIKCDKKFNSSDVIEETLERHYAYEIMKVGAKGGCIPLSICPKCKLGTFLNYEDICIYCGNRSQGEYDPDFEYELFSRNVNDYWDDIS